MAVAGGVKPCVSMWVGEDGTLQMGRPEQTVIAQSDMDKIMAQLEQGKKVWVETYGRLPVKVQEEWQVRHGGTQD